MYPANFANPWFIWCPVHVEYLTELNRIAEFTTGKLIFIFLISIFTKVLCVDLYHVKLMRYGSVLVYGAVWTVCLNFVHIAIALRFSFNSLVHKINTLYVFTRNTNCSLTHISGWGNNAVAILYLSHVHVVELHLE